MYKKLYLASLICCGLVSTAYSDESYTKNDFINDLNSVANIYRTAETYTCYEEIQTSVGSTRISEMATFMIENPSLFNTAYNKSLLIDRSTAASFYNDWMISYKLISDLSSTKQNAGDYNRQFCYNHYANLIYASNFGLIANILAR